VDIPKLDQSVFHSSEDGEKIFSFSDSGNYLGRFSLLGDPYLKVVRKDGEFVGSLVFVKRQVAGKTFWYIDDAKVAPQYRGKFLFEFMDLFRHYFRELVQDSPFYMGVIVAQGNDSDQRLLRFYDKMMGGTIQEITKLYEFTLSSPQLECAKPVIERYRGPINGFLILGQDV
ncbi:hypothetical protein EBR96_03410, partial [bacterium]|nr:hypothetical protein [bacterium]